MGELLEILFEVTAHVFGDFVLEGLSRSRSPLLRTVSYAVVCAVFGLFLGAISIAVHPHPIIQSRTLRLVMLVLLPTANGFLMSGLGATRQKKGQERSRFEFFVPAVIFSLVFGLARYFGAE